MLEQGYGSVTYRSIAAKAGVAAGLVQYYFPSLDDLFVAVLRSGTDRVIEGLEDAARSERPLRALWNYANDLERHGAVDGVHGPRQPPAGRQWRHRRGW